MFVLPLHACRDVFAGEMPSAGIAAAVAREPVSDACVAHLKITHARSPRPASNTMSVKGLVKSMLDTVPSRLARISEVEPVAAVPNLPNLHSPPGLY